MSPAWGSLVCGQMAQTDAMNLKTSQDPRTHSGLKHQDGLLLDEHFGLVEQLQESEADQETEAERMVRELIVDKKAQNIQG
jgi:hypothetical protein